MNCELSSLPVEVHQENHPPKDSDIAASSK